MNAIFEAAQKRRAELVQELQKLDVFLETYQSLALELRMGAADARLSPELSTENASGGVSEQTSDKEEAAAAAEMATRVRVRDNPKPKDVVTAAVELIREAGFPMTRREIHTALAERGMEVRGADPIKALGTMLWRSGRDQLVQLEGRGYWPKAEPYHPAGYYPGLKEADDAATKALVELGLLEEGSGGEEVQDKRSLFGPNYHR